MALPFISTVLTIPAVFTKEVEEQEFQKKFEKHDGSWNSSPHKQEGEERRLKRKRYFCKQPWPLRAYVRDRLRSRGKAALSLPKRKKQWVAELISEDSHVCCHIEVTCSLRSERSSFRNRVLEGGKWSEVRHFGGLWRALNNGLIFCWSRLTFKKKFYHLFIIVTATFLPLSDKWAYFI